MNESNQILDFENNGVRMTVDGDFLYLGAKGTIYKYRLKDMGLINQKKIARYNPKNMYSMVFFSVYDNYVFVCDFCDLHILQKADLKLTNTVRLGENNSSDIFGIIHYAYPNVYVGIRNGRIDVLDLQTNKVIQHKICDSSNWSNCVIRNRLYYSTTNGELFDININTMEIERRVQLTKNMNTYSVVYHKGLLYTTSEKSFKVVDIDSFEIVKTGTELFHSTEANIISILNNHLIVAELKRIAVYNADILHLRERFDFPTGYRFMRYAVLHDDILYGSDEHGIYSRKLSF